MIAGEPEPVPEKRTQASIVNCRVPASSALLFFNSANAFNIELPPVPDLAFTEEPRRALDPATPTGLIACDISAQLECAFPATTPLVLASYARIRAGETLEDAPGASGVITYVIRGAGTARCGDESVDWREGDLMLFPGGCVQQYHADEQQDAVLRRMMRL